MTASEQSLNTADAVVRHIERVCQVAVDGRRAARALAAWTRRFELSDAEFQLLWRLRAGAGDGSDQTTLARELAFSAAQVSATVERMRARGWISQHSAEGDRRRHLWRLSSSGRLLLDAMMRCAAELHDPQRSVERWDGDDLSREVAA